MKIKAYGATDIGKVRENNEDNFLIYSAGDEKEGSISKKKTTEKGVLLLVADGMGGAAAGETAAALVISSARAYSKEAINEVTPMEIAYNSLIIAHEACRIVVEKNPSLAGMGSVATIVFVKDEKAFIAQVGDTRLYLYRNHSLEQITEDQNLVTELVKFGLITEEQAQYHPQRNAVTQAVGAGDDLNPVETILELEIGDKLLLCSDGLNGTVSDVEIQLILDGSNDLEDVLQTLIDTANANGGHDNITIILAEILE
ncbi:MAG: protein phosphatase 2C domain-containing protein [Leptospiraceae bacterium]|nr:protein phosphatase 2C domain-containing protein [Leptospiraceae bacterium]